MVMVNITDLVQFVTDRLDISFTVWLGILNEAILLNTSHWISRTYINVNKTINIIRLKIYPIIEEKETDDDEANYTYAKYCSYNRVKKTQLLQRYAARVNAFLNDNQKALCAGYIQKVLTEPTITYPNLTELTFYAYIKDNNKINAIIADFIKKYKDTYVVCFPCLKTIIVHYLPDTDNNPDFIYYYKQAATKTNTYSLTDDNSVNTPIADNK
ncbi:hypothetical protein NEOKW01_1341 [Nematocida sp. AWRm80]|nr:hypothetical protein NEOKW01_1341 [Nematocida sp. AWRm80]